jgi:hypothetical protein
MREATACHLSRQNGHGIEVLLGSRRSSFCNRVLNGPGGGLHKGEGISAGGKRETCQEVSSIIDLSSVWHFATVDSYHPSVLGGHNLEYRVYHLNVTRWEGEPCITEERAFWYLRWFAQKRLPYKRMMPDVALWMPLTLKNKDPQKLLEVEAYYADVKLKMVEKILWKWVDRPKGLWPKRKP